MAHCMVNNMLRSNTGVLAVIDGRTMPIFATFY
jgi:hypothetical protein